MFSMIWYGSGVFQIFETELRTVKTAFCEYWTSIKILYEIKTKVLQWLQLKLKFLLGYNLKIVILN